MKLGIRVRLMALTTALVLMGCAIALLTLSLQRRSAELRVQLSEVANESFERADDLRTYLADLNDSLYHYGRSGYLPDVSGFQRSSQELQLWIQSQQSAPSAPEFKEVMGQIDLAYARYVQAATNLLARLVTIGRSSASVDEYIDLRLHSRRLTELALMLARTTVQSQSKLVAEAIQNANRLRKLVLVALAGLFLAGAGLAWMVYREMISPLRLKLVETETLAARREKLASLGTLAAGVAHEIRNPLTAIKAAVFIQERKSSPGSQDHADAQLMMREISRLDRIVESVLHFARPPNPQLLPVAVEVPLREVLALLGPALLEMDIEPVLEPCPSMRVEIDADQIKQVLINVVQNAADSIGRHGRVTLRARPDRIRLRGRDREVVVLEVSDTGRGIPAEVQKRLFDPFFTTKETGTGLGLAIAARIVEEHGGALQYQTQLNVGTTFGIVLPRTLE
jgi:signal transduction histidine kinase